METGMEIIRNEERGFAKHSWLQSRHSFSFADYHDPARMGVSALRVINDDYVAPKGGFAAHPHRNMEIISYVKSGVIEHKDSMGNIQTLPAGEFQLMSAGSGITHSEYNPSATDALAFLQIWILPNEKGGTPQYQQKRFAPVEGLQLIASPNGAHGSFKLRQDAKLFELKQASKAVNHLTLDPGRTLYVHVIDGEVEIENQVLVAGDGAQFFSSTAITLVAQGNGVHALLFDLP